MAKTKRSRLPAGIKLLADGRFRVRATYKSALGKRSSVQATLPAETPLSQAVAKREELLADLLAEDELLASVPRLSAYIDSWVTRKKGRVRKKTAETYASSLAHLDADLGQVHLDKLERRHLVWWRDEIQKEVGTYSASTVARWWRYGLAVIRDGLAENCIADTITQRIDGPAGKTGPRRERRTLSRGQIRQVVEAADEEALGSLIAFLAYTGCRFGEAVGLRWCDVHLDEAPHARLQISKVEVKGGWQVEELKSGEGRVIGFPPCLVEILKAHQDECPGVGLAPVWTTSKGGPIRKVYIYRALDRVQTALELDVKLRPQVFRRSVNTLGLERGLDRVLLQELLGHADNDMTRLYAGLLPETAARAAAEVWS